MSKTQRRNERRRQKKVKDNDVANDDDIQCQNDLVGTWVKTRCGRTGIVMLYDPDDEMLAYKIVFIDRAGTIS